MASFEFGDQPDYYDTATLPRYWDLSNDMDVAGGEGLAGSDAWEGGGSGAYVVKFPLVVHATRFGFIVRVKIDALPASPLIVLGAPDAGDPPALQVCCTINADGTVSIYRGDSTGTLLATSADVLPSDGSTFRLAFTGLISPTSGNAAVLFAAGDDALVEIAQAGGVDTDATGSGVRRGVYLGGVTDVFTSHLFTQGSGTLPHSPIVDVLMPLDDSTLQDWSVEPPGSPVNMADATDDVPANDDTDYGYSTAVNQRYALQHATAPSRLSYLGVQTVALVQNAEDSTPPGSPALTVPTYTFTPLIKNDGLSVSLGAVRSVTASDWKGVENPQRVNPFTGLPWTTATINAYGWGGKTTV